MKVIFISTVPATSLALTAKDLKAEFDHNLDFKIYYPARSTRRRWTRSFSKRT